LSIKKYFTVRVLILIAAIILALVAISPNPWASGIEISSVESGSDLAYNGMASGQKLFSINGESIESISEVYEILDTYGYDEQEIEVETDNETLTYNITNDIGFEVDENLTIIYSEVELSEGSVLLEINGEEVDDLNAFNDIYNELVPKETYKFETSAGLLAYISREIPDFKVEEASKSNIVLGLDFVGGTRVLLQPIAEEGSEITDQDITTLIEVLENRLNVYGLSDIKIRSSNDWEGNKYVLIELAGVTEREVQDLLSQQGKFEAKIGDAVVFEGGQEDILYVCRNDGSCSGIRTCNEVQGGHQCTFDFTITLSQEAAEAQAAATDELDVVVGENGKNYLSGTIDFYLDGEVVDSLQISEDLKGKATTTISITGPGVGATRDDAIDDAALGMNQLQTILITGSLPFDIEVVKIDTVSPVLGESFIENVLLVGVIAILAVIFVLFLRYRTWKVIVPISIALTSELIIILGFAALVRWNLDMAAIAGIIAAIGTGVDDQIVILDETIKNKETYINWQEKLKRAFFIIFVAYATTVAAMIPLWNAGAGLIRGFALTTIVGVTIGVFLTRPAFGSIVEKLYKE